LTVFCKIIENQNTSSKADWDYLLINFEQAAKTLEECWQLVETSERTRKHCMMMENSCYGFFDLLMLNRVRQGFWAKLFRPKVHTIIHYLAKSSLPMIFYP
jgi:hypothetical protein